MHGGPPAFIVGYCPDTSIVSLSGGGHMGDDAPDAVRFVVDAQDADGDTGAAGRAAALGVGTQAVDAAIQGHKSEPKRS